MSAVVNVPRKSTKAIVGAGLTLVSTLVTFYIAGEADSLTLTESIFALVDAALVFYGVKQTTNVPKAPEFE